MSHHFNGCVRVWYKQHDRVDPSSLVSTGVGVVSWCTTSAWRHLDEATVYPSIVVGRRHAPATAAPLTAEASDWNDPLGHQLSNQAKHLLIIVSRTILWQYGQRGRVKMKKLDWFCNLESHPLWQIFTSSRQQNQCSRLRLTWPTDNLHWNTKDKIIKGNKPEVLAKHSHYTDLPLQTNHPFFLSSTHTHTETQTHKHTL